MAKTKMYFQCDLSQGTGRDKAYIEDRGAVIGHMVELGGEGTENFWRIDSVSSVGLTEETLKKLQDKSHQGWAKSIDI